MANPNPDSAAMTQRGVVAKDDNGVAVGWKYAYITAAAPTTTVVKMGAGVLHSITINGPAATGTIKVDDAVTDTNPFITITTPASPQPVTLTYDVAFSTGLTIVTGTAAQNITVAYI